MTAFVGIAAIMLALALFFILPSLLRKGSETASVQLDALNLEVLRDQLRELDADLELGAINAGGYQDARRELERRVVEDVQVNSLRARTSPQQRWSALMVALAIPIAATLLYSILGEPSALEPPQVSRAEEASPPPVTAEQIESMISRLAEKLRTKPDDANGWRMLARSYETMGRFDDAVDAYRHLLKLTPNDADMLTNYAVTLAITSNRSLSGEPEKLINRALEIEPTHIQALALSGSIAFERKEYAEAIKLWRRILALAPRESELAQTIANSIAKAESLSKRVEIAK